MEQPWFIFIIVLIIFGILVLGVFLFRKYFLNKKNQEDNEIPSEEQIAQEELDNFLVDIDDSTQQAFFEKNENVTPSSNATKNEEVEVSTTKEDE